MNSQPFQQLLNQTRQKLLSNTEKLQEYLKNQKQAEEGLSIKTILQYISNQDQGSLLTIQCIQKNKDIAKLTGEILVKMKTSSAPPAPVEKLQQSKKKNDKKKQQSQGKPARSNSLLRGMLSKIIKTEPQGVQMKLPDKQPKCVYDPIRKIYVIEGQEQEQVKEIPKPPPNKNKSLTSNISTKNATKKTEVDQMTAPPAYVRKGAKNKEKSAGPGQKRQSGSSMNFQKFIQKVDSEFAQLLSAFKNFKLQSKKIVQPVLSVQPIRDQKLEKSLLNKFDQYTAIWSSMNQFSEQIHSQIEKDLEIFQHGSQKSPIKALLKQINQSSSVYREALEKITDLNDCGRLKKKKRPSNDSAIAAQEQKRVHNEYNQLKKHYENLHVERNLKQNQFSKVHQQLELQKRNSEEKLMNAISQRQKLMQNVQELTQQNQELQQDYNVLQSQIKKMASFLGIDINEIMNTDMEDQMPDEIIALDKIKHHISHMKQELRTLKLNLNQRNLQFNTFIEEKDVLIKTIKLQERLIEQMRQHEDLTEEFSQANSSQNQLLNKVTKTRLALNSDMSSSTNDSRNMTDQSRNKAILANSRNLQSFLQLSNASSCITKSYIENIKSLRSLAQMWQEKYHNVKQNMEKSRHNLGSQQASLNRTINKLKSLVETYKMSQEQAQNRASNLQLECQKLRKQVVHLRHQQSFSKQMLEQSMRNSQSHQGDLENLQSELEDTIKNYHQIKAENQEKDQIIDSMDKEIEQLQRQNKKLSNSVKQQERRFSIEVEGTIESKKQLQQSLKDWKIKYEQLMAENQQLVSHYESEKKNLQQALIKKDKQMKDQLKKITKTSDSWANQLKEVTQELDQSRKTQQAIHEQLNKQRRINSQIQEAINEMTQRHQKIKSEWRKEQQQTEEKINYLLSELQSSSKKSQQLTINLCEYRTYIENLMKQYEATKNAQKQEKTQMEALLTTMQGQIKEKDETILVLNEQIQQLRLESQSKELITTLQERVIGYETYINELKQTIQNNQESVKVQLQQKQQEIAETLSILQERQNQTKLLGQQLNKLKSILDDLEKNNNNRETLQSKNQQLQSLVNQLRNMISKINLQRQEQKVINENKINELNDLLAALQEDNNKIDQTNKELEKSNRKYEYEMSQLTRQIDAKKQFIANVGNSKIQHEQQVNTLLETIAQLQAKIARFDEQSKRLTQKSSTEDRLTNANQEEQIRMLLIQQQQTIQNLNSQNQTARENLQELQSKYRKLQKEFSEQKEELADAQLKVSEIAMKLKLAQQSNRGKNINSGKQVVQSKQDVAQRDSQIRQLTQKIQQLNTSIKRIKKNHQLEISTLKETNDHLTQKQLLAEDKITELEKEITKVNSYKKKIKQLSAQITDLQSDNSELLQQKTDLLKANQKLSETVSNLRSKEALSSTNNQEKSNQPIKNENPKSSENKKVVFDESKKQNIPSQSKRTDKGQVKSQIKSDPKPKPKGGFFASLFLTPSEVQRMQTQ